MPLDYHASVRPCCACSALLGILLACVPAIGKQEEKPYKTAEPQAAGRDRGRKYGTGGQERSLPDPHRRHQVSGASGKSRGRDSGLLLANRVVGAMFGSRTFVGFFGHLRIAEIREMVGFGAF